MLSIRFMIRLAFVAVSIHVNTAFSPSHAFVLTKIPASLGTSPTHVVLQSAPSSLFSSETLRVSSPQQQTNLLNNRHSASDWFYNVKSIFQSEILREVRGPVVACAGWSLVVSMMHRILLHTIPAWGHNMCITGTAHSFLVSALGLLLVFRTNSAYQRFYEGRKIWENILSISRNLSRIVNLYGKEIGTQRKTRILNLVAAFPYLLRHHIRPGCLCNTHTVDPAHRLQLWEPVRLAVETRHEGDKTCGGTTQPEDLLSEKNGGRQSMMECFVDKRDLPWCLFEPMSLPKVAVSQNRPLWACDRIGRELMSIPYGPNYTSRERLAMLSHVEKLTNAVGQCERIHQTAVPLNYARHSLRSLTLWLFTLPFCLIKDLGLLTAPVTACVAWALLGVYQIGYSIEDPFQGSLRLSMLCDAIRRDVIGDDVRNHFDDGHSQYNLEDLWVDGTNEHTATKTKPSSHPHMPLHLLKEEAFLNSTPQLIQENDGVWNVVGVVEG